MSISDNKKTIIFSPAVYNLAETTRCIEIAKICKKIFNILFISYGGDFENLIEQEKFDYIKLEPELTEEKIEHIYKVDQGEKLSPFFYQEEIKLQVENEIALFKKIKPAAVVTGFNFSNSISCKAAKIPLIWLTQSTWMIETGYKSGVFTYPDMLNLPVLRWIGEKALLKFFLFIYSLFSSFIISPYNKVAREYGTPLFKNIEDLWTGDYNLLPEPKDFCEMETPESFHFIGPLIGKIDAPVPNEILKLPKDRPIIYFAMGSSGQPKIIKKIIESFNGKPYYVITPSKSKIQNIDITIPPNVIVTGWLPAHKVNPIADISIIHGGIGTVMTAVLAGKPIVGISMMQEQEANIDCLVKKGFALRIRKNTLTPEKLLNTIEKLLSDDEAKEKALSYKKSTEQWFDPGLTLNFFKNHFL